MTLEAPIDTGVKKEESSKPEFGSSGKKIVYDKDGKPYVFLQNYNIPSISESNSEIL